MHLHLNKIFVIFFLRHKKKNSIFIFFNKHSLIDKAKSVYFSDINNNIELLVLVYVLYAYIVAESVANWTDC